MYLFEFICFWKKFLWTKMQFDCTNVQFDCIRVQSEVQCTFYLRRRVFVGVTFSIPRSERTSAFGILQQETCLVIFAHWTSTIWSLNFQLKFRQNLIVSSIIWPEWYGSYRWPGNEKIYYLMESSAWFPVRFWTL